MPKKHNNKGRSIGDARHLRLYYWLLRSEAWRVLSSVERCTYIELAKRYDGKNNGYISLSCREVADELHVSKATVSRAFNKLIEVGFITVMEKGAFSRKMRQATEYRLNEHKCDKTKELASKQFMRWSAGKNK